MQIGVKSERARWTAKRKSSHPIGFVAVLTPTVSRGIERRKDRASERELKMSHPMEFVAAPTAAASRGIEARKDKAAEREGVEERDEEEGDERDVVAEEVEVENG